MEQAERLTLAVATVLASGLLWTGSCIASQVYFDFAHYSLGVDLIYLPAGVRLLLVTAFGLRGATGIALSHPIPTLMEYGQQSPLEVITASIISGFVPLLAVTTCYRLMGVQCRLSVLRLRHMLALALAVSVVTPVAFMIHHLAFGTKSVQALFSDLPVLAVGDLAGCLVFLLPVVAAYSIVGGGSPGGRASS